MICHQLPRDRDDSWPSPRTALLSPVKPESSKAWRRNSMRGTRRLPRSGGVNAEQPKEPTNAKRSSISRPANPYDPDGRSFRRDQEDMGAGMGQARDFLRDQRTQVHFENRRCGDLCHKPGLLMSMWQTIKLSFGCVVAASEASSASSRQKRQLFFVRTAGQKRK